MINQFTNITKEECCARGGTKYKSKTQVCTIKKSKTEFIQALRHEIIEDPYLILNRCGKISMAPIHNFI